MMDQISSRQVSEDEDDLLLRQYVLSEEDRQLRHPTTKWIGGYRWFRSPNVICLDRYRSSEDMARIHNRFLAEAKFK